ncbi:MAG TPA: hypothetical protein VGO07_05690 [Candidatus Saccharimonadales bacterium]|jgi:hypothetical protein|nr:hypothetical protein [Candidatus Saccharimonadales bacterium]
MRKQNKNKKPFKKTLFIVATALVCLAGLFVILEKTNTINLVHKRVPPAQTATQDTKGEPQQPAANQSGASTTPANQNNPGDDKSTAAQPAASTPPKDPTGDFVSNYQPTLTAPRNLIESVCTTTPGAQCRISFTKDNTTKQLDPMTADKGGSAYWTWKLQDVGLTTGSWKITATATLNGKTVTANSPLRLEVKP